jgi:hypothetical protein
MEDTLDPPSEGVIFERLRTESTIWINAVHLQVTRIDRRHAQKYMELEDITAVEVDLHFLLVALVRLQRCVNRVGANIPGLSASLDQRASIFEREIPSLRKLRNVSEHIDEYNLDAGRNRSVSRRQVQTWAFDTNDDGGLVWRWLGETLDVRRSQEAAVALYRGFLSECDAYFLHHRTKI